MSSVRLRGSDQAVDRAEASAGLCHEAVFERRGRHRGAAEGQKDADNPHNAESDRQDQPREKKGGGPVQRTTECSWGTPCREPAPNATPASGPEGDFSAIRGRCYRSECSRGCRCGRLGLRTARPLGQTVLVSPSTQSFVTETGALGGPALLVHGGAGTFERLRDGASRARLESGLASALEAGWDVLQRGGDALHATVEAVARLEDSGLFNAGRGSTPTTEGIIETDASVMDGATGAAGAVCAATWPANPVRAALIVATHGQADPFFDPSVPVLRSL